MIDGTHSFIDACKHLKVCDAQKVVILAAHGLFSGHAIEEIQASSYVDEVITTNTFPMSEEKRAGFSKLRVIDVAAVFAEAIRRTHNGESISYLFHTAI
jgi:ribose-phosphate pyrophosphokinase